MPQINAALLDPVGQAENTENFNRVMTELETLQTNLDLKAVAATVSAQIASLQLRDNVLQAQVFFLNGLAPGVESYPESVYDYLGNDVFPVDSTGVTFAVLTGTTYDFNIAVTGEAPLLESTVAAEIFGETPSETNAFVVALALPSEIYSEVKKDDVVINEAALEVLSNIPYLVIVGGVYDNEGTPTMTTDHFTITWQGKAVSFGFDLTGLTLATAE